MWCAVHPNFKCIVVVDKDDVLEQKIPLPFLNRYRFSLTIASRPRRRFEKQLLSRDELITVEEHRLVEALHHRCVEFAQGLPLSHVFPGYTTQTLYSLASMLVAAAKRGEIEGAEQSQLVA